MSKKLTVKRALQETELIWNRIAGTGARKVDADFKYIHGCPCCYNKAVADLCESRHDNKRLLEEAELNVKRLSEARAEIQKRDVQIRLEQATYETLRQDLLKEAKQRVEAGHRMKELEAVNQTLKELITSAMAGGVL